MPARFTPAPPPSASLHTPTPALSAGDAVSPLRSTRHTTTASDQHGPAATPSTDGSMLRPGCTPPDDHHPARGSHPRQAPATAQPAPDAPTRSGPTRKAATGSGRWRSPFQSGFEGRRVVAGLPLFASRHRLWTTSGTKAPDLRLFSRRRISEVALPMRPPGCRGSGFEAIGRPEGAPKEALQRSSRFVPGSGLKAAPEFIGGTEPD